MEEQLLDEYVKAVVAERTRVLTERIEELELRLDVYHGNMYDIVAQQNEQLRKALMRFGDLKNWRSGEHGEPVWVGSPDPWQEARTALKGKDPENGSGEDVPLPEHV